VLPWGGFLCNLIYILYGSLYFFVAGTNVQDDPRLNEYNLPELVDLFVEYAQNQVCNVTVSQILFVLCDILSAVEGKTDC
jgi:hypothetical protein